MQRRILEEQRMERGWRRYRRESLKRLDKRHLAVGVMVCNCDYRHSRIKWINPEEPDDIILESGACCSVLHCGIAPVREPCPHPSRAYMEKFIQDWWAPESVKERGEEYLALFK